MSLGYTNYPFYDFNSNLQIRNNEDNSDSQFDMTIPVKNWDQSQFVSYILSVFFKTNNALDKEFCLENAIYHPNVPELLNNLRLEDFLKIDSKHGESLHASLVALNNRYYNCNQNTILVQNLNKMDIGNQNVPNMDLVNSSSSASVDSGSDSDIDDKNYDNLMPFIQSNDFELPDQTQLKRNNSPNQIVPKQKKTKDCLHVWQFCRDLLIKNEIDIVEWVDTKNGIFKVNNKDEFARRWGLKKQRKDPTKMSYENMSRGMRHSRKESGYFKYPEKKKKFVYQFGEKAVESCEWLKSLSRGANV